MKGYKAFYKNMICKGDGYEKQYEENTTYEENGNEVCKSGVMHFCENPFDVLNYYPLVDGKCNVAEFAEVEALGDTFKKSGADDKTATNKLHIGAKLNLKGFIKACIDFSIEKTIRDITSSGDDAQLASSGALKFNVTREIKPSTVNEVVDVNGTKFEVYSGERCFITTQSYTREDIDEIVNIWAENNHEEYIEKPKISRSDRTFLDYIPDDYKYMARDEDGMLFTYKERPRRRSKMWIHDSELFGIHKAKVRFPMVKWEDKEPWLVEYIKKLEVVDEY